MPNLGCCTLAIASFRKSKTAVLIVVSIALFLDSILFTSIVPYVPAHSFIEIQNGTNDTMYDIRSSSPPLRGLVIFMKPLVQMVFHPVTILLPQRIGYQPTLIFGLLLDCISTIGHSFGENYPLQLFMRAIQGWGSKSILTAGVEMVLSRYGNFRVAALSTLNGFLALGWLIGPLYSSTFFTYAGENTGYVLLGVLVVLNALLVASVTKDNFVSYETTSFWSLARNPTAIIDFGAFALNLSGVACLQAFLGSWLSTYHSNTFFLGLVFIPTGTGYLLGLCALQPFIKPAGRRSLTASGILLGSASLLSIPHILSRNFLFIPMFMLGLSMALTETNLALHFSHLVDARCSLMYEIAVCGAYGWGAAIGGLMIHSTNFNWTTAIIAAVSILYTPMLFIS